MSNYSAGSIKFKRDVTLDTIIGIANDLRNPGDGWGEGWRDLHIRAAGDDGTHYLAFSFDVHFEGKEYNDQFQTWILNVLRHRLGTDRRGRPLGVRGWSMSNVLWS